MINNIYPLPYCIPDELVVTDVPSKKFIWAEVIPDFKETYRFGPDEENEYYQMYKDSRFAFTWKKGGWDALRHYEIIANGCIPVFRDLEKCPHNTMITFPKHIIVDAMRTLLPWKECEEYKIKYNIYVQSLLEWCRKHMTCSAIAKYFMKTLDYKQIISVPKILFITCQPHTNYTREFLFIGMYRLFQQLNGICVAWPKINFLHDDYPVNELRKCHGMGFGYGRRLPAIADHNEEFIIDQIKKKSWDYIVYAKIGYDEGSIGSIPSAPLWPIVSEFYQSDRIVFLYGEDSPKNLQTNSYDRWTTHLLNHTNLGRCFVRELIK